MKNNVKNFKYIGISDADFRNGNIYEAEPVTESLGDFMSIKDETGEWYNYDLEFFEENFVEV